MHVNCIEIKMYNTFVWIAISWNWLCVFFLLNEVGITFTVYQLQSEHICAWKCWNTVGGGIIWSPADFVCLPAEKEIINL